MAAAILGVGRAAPDFCKLRGGSVGTGTANPGATLDVAGNIRVGTTAQTGAANRFRMLQSMVRVTKTGSQTLANNTATADPFRAGGNGRGGRRWGGGACGEASHEPGGAKLGGVFGAHL